MNVQSAEGKAGSAERRGLTTKYQTHERMEKAKTVELFYANYAN
jgi:hypothetical protein